MKAVSAFHAKLQNLNFNNCKIAKLPYETACGNVEIQFLLQTKAVPKEHRYLNEILC